METFSFPIVEASASPTLTHGWALKISVWNFLFDFKRRITRHFKYILESFRRLFHQGLTWIILTNLGIIWKYNKLK